MFMVMLTKAFGKQQTHKVNAYDIDVHKKNNKSELIVCLERRCTACFILLLRLWLFILSPEVGSNSSQETLPY